jgi:serine/threonine protein kinase/Tfp pilus assembly protein PilF
LATALQDRYRLDRELGQGGMATVYLAHDLRNNRPVALKLLRPELAAILGAERFLKEIETTANLQHPHILPLFDSGAAHPSHPERSEGSLSFLYYVMPYVDGESLRDRLTREKQLPIDEALRLATEIAGALDYAHQQGVIHRDIKPENILLSRGHALVADFGIALAVREAGGARLTETGLSVGTPQYMSPEQATAERQLDARSDIYSLGAVLYEMLAGEPPFTGATGQAVIAKLMTERPTRLRIVRATVPDAVDDAVARALAKVPADRFPTAAAFAAALREGQQSAASRSAPHIPSRRFALLVLTLLIVLGAIAWRVIVGGRRGRDPDLVALTQHASHSYGRRTSAGVNEAIREFNAAVQRDSTYAAAWAGLAKAYARAYERYFPVPGVTRDSTLQLAVAAADRAMTSDSGDAQAWLARGIASRVLDPTDVEPTLQSVRHSLLLDSTVAEAWHYLAIALAEHGDLDDAMKQWHRAIRVDPNYSMAIAFLGLGHYWRDQFDSAGVWADSAVALDPTFILARSTAGYVDIERGEYTRAAAAFDAARRLTGDGDVEAANALAGSALMAARAGRSQEARSLVQRAESLATAYKPVPLHTAVYIAQAHLGLGEVDRALAWLTRYQPSRDLHFQLHLRCDPPLDPLRGDPRFQSLLTLPRPPKGTGC